MHAPDKKSPGNPPDKEAEIDEYELYYGENAVHDEPVIKVPGPLSRLPELSSVYPAFALSMLFFICTFILADTSMAEYLWASRLTVFTEHEYWRLFTSIFTHADIVHLMSNLPFFIFFGLVLYEYFGLLLFPLVPLLTGAFANAFTLYFYPPGVRLIGASGMVYGMVSAWLVLYICHDKDRTVFVRIFRSAGFALIVLFPETYNPSTSYLVHAAGFVTGMIFALLLLPFVKVRAHS